MKVEVETVELWGCELRMGWDGGGWGAVLKRRKAHPERREWEVK